MNRLFSKIPLLVILAICAVLLVHGPIRQSADYHAFANQLPWFGVPRAADVFSNIGFALVGGWGWWRLRGSATHPALRAGWFGYRLLFAGLILTALGSGFYHWAPDNFRLIFDRLPITLVSAGLLAAVRAETRADGGVNASTVACGLALFGVLSVGWWYFTELQGQGDLRPYLLLQMAPLILIPLWQAIYRAPRADRAVFGLALLCYIVAKAAEMNDQAIWDALGWISGHTLKHLIATLAMVLITARLMARVTTPKSHP